MSTNDSTDDPDEQSYELTARELEGLQTRWAIASSLGQQFGGERSLYDTFGWVEQPDVEDFWAMYLRNPYGKTVVDLPVETSWRDPPEIEDDEDAGADTQTDFEDDIDTLTDALRVWHYCKRADKLAGIGEYGLLLIGFADDGDWAAPVDESALPDDPAEAIQHLRPFSQLSVEDIRLGGPDSDRWGRPIYYQLDLGDVSDYSSFATNIQEGSEKPGAIWVHHERVVHIAEGRLDDEVRGTPRQEPVLNALYDIEKALGSAAEAAYRGADKGLHVNVDKEYDLTDGGEDMREGLQRWYHDLEPFIRTQGAEIEELGGTDINPQQIIDSEIEAIAAQTGIPQSILKGNETGERATQEDRKEWYGVAAGRREQFTTPVIVRELFDRFIKFSVLTAPTGDRYNVNWPPLEEPSEAEIADVHLARSKVAKNLSGVAPSISTEQWVEYIEEGTIPDAEDVDIEPMDAPDPAPDPTETPGVADSESTEQDADDEEAPDDETGNADAQAQDQTPYEREMKRIRGELLAGD